MLGTNDAGVGAPTPQATYQSNLQSTITALKAAGFNKIMLSFSPYNWAGTVSNAYLLLYQTAIRNLVAADPAHVFLGDTQAYSVFQDNPGFLADGTHPNNAGYAVLGQSWATAFQRSFIPSGSLTANQTLQLIANVTGTSNTAVTWSILNGGPGAISTSGVYTAPASISTQQTVTVQAMSLADNTVTATATITLNPAVAVTLNPNLISLNASQTQQFTSTVTGTANKGVTWSLSPSTGSGSITAGGLYTAPANVTSPQTVLVQVSSAVDPLATAGAIVTVNPPSTALSVIAIGGTPQSATVNTSFGSGLQATVKDAGNNPVSGVTVTFTAPSSGPGATFAGSNTASVVTNGSGVATAPALIANGQAGSYNVTASVAGVAGTATSV